MKNNQLRTFIIIGLLSILLIGCSGGIQKYQSLSAVNDVEEVQTSQAETKEGENPVEEVSLTTAMDVESAKFSIKAILTFKKLLQNSMEVFLKAKPALC